MLRLMVGTFFGKMIGAWVSMDKATLGKRFYKFLFVGGEMTLRKRVLYLLFAFVMILLLYVFAFLVLIPDKFD